MKFLYVHSVLLLKSLNHRGFVKLLTITQFFHNAGLLKFTLELLQRFLDVLAFFYRYYNHFFSFKYLNWLIIQEPPISDDSSRKITHSLFIHKTFRIKSAVPKPNRPYLKCILVLAAPLPRRFCSALAPLFLRFYRSGAGAEQKRSKYASDTTRIAGRDANRGSRKAFLPAAFVYSRYSPYFCIRIN